MTFEHQCILDSSGVYGKVSHPILRGSDSVGLGWEPEICIFKQASNGNSDSHWTILPKDWLPFAHHM